VAGTSVGLLQVLSRDPDAFDQRRLRLWDEVAQQVSLVISTLQISFDNKRLSRQQHLISLINHAGATASSREETYQQLAQIGLRLPGVESSTIFLWHDEDNLLEIAHEAVIDEALRRYRAGERIIPGSWIDDGIGLRRREPLHFYRANQNPSDAERLLLDRIGMGRASIFMLLDEGEVHGVLVLKSRDEDPFPEETVRLAETVAVAAAAVLRNARARDEERRTEREQQALLRLSRAATNCDTVDDLLTVVADTVRTLCEADCSEIYTFAFDNLTELGAVSNGPGCDNPCKVGSTWPTGHWSIEEQIQSSMHPIVILDLTDPRVSDQMRADLKRVGVQSLAFMPLPIGDGIRGFVAVFASEPRRFTSHLIRSTASVVNQAALAIDHMRTRIEEMRIGEQRALLLQVSQAAGSSLELETVLSEIAIATLGGAQAVSCFIELFDA
jgi:transcriptional regulator with GAF, ATPase, and Fis domain